MNIIETILMRRSIRKFHKTEIPPETIQLLLKAAMYAPSARNTQAWNFIVVTDRHLLDQLAVIHPYAKMLKYAPLAILVCGDKLIEENESYLAVNCSAATQNLLLAAHSLGLGSVWLGVYPKPDRIQPISDLLNLPLDCIPISMIALGFPDEQREQPQRFCPEKIHYNNKW